ncbi:MAG: pseudaminic acid synthase [Candidatus Spechtbacteria bacterium]|nr:pseudaminic acid synthase [Candidatus Spechtbacteria bacterium]
MVSSIKIGNKLVGDDEPCFVVAEVSANHMQSFKMAAEIVRAAARAGADAVKLQTYTPDTLTIDSRKEWFLVGGKDNPDSWQGKTFYDLYKTAYTPWDWHPKLKEIAESLGLIFFSTPFDETAVDFLSSLNVPCFKVASYECTDVLLLKKIARTGKPVIMSIGFATLQEVELSLQTLQKYGACEIAVLHCVTSYSDTPDPYSINLRTILDIRERFGVVSGFSDNNAGIEAPCLAAAMGASIVEKHVVSSHADPTYDARFSIDPQELTQMVETIRRQEALKGQVNYGPNNLAEEHNRGFRRSLFAVADIKRGQQFTSENIRSIRPANGLPTRFFDEIIGKAANQDIERGTPLSWNLIS